MKDTKERIMRVALRLFSTRGYDAVSVGDIAGELSLAKSALYRHFKNKRAILDELLSRIPPILPPAGETGIFGRLDALGSSLFARMTEGDSALLCRLLTVSQYTNGEMAALYRKHLLEEPLRAVKEELGFLPGEQRENAALAFFSPIFVLATRANAGEDPVAVRESVRSHIRQYADSIGGEKPITDRETLLSVAGAVLSRNLPRKLR